MDIRLNKIRLINFYT